MAYFGQLWDFRTIAMDWTNIGMFDIILPMLLVFVVVYSTLQRTKILTGKKEIDAITALIVSFFLMGNPEVAGFFKPLFANAALGIAILLVFLLMMGLFVAKPKTGTWNMITMIGGAAVFLWVMSRATQYFGYDIIFSQYWWSNNSWWVIPVILLAIIIGVVVSSGREGSEEDKFEAWEKLYGK